MTKIAYLTVLVFAVIVALKIYQKDYDEATWAGYALFWVLCYLTKDTLEKKND